MSLKLGGILIAYLISSMAYAPTSASAAEEMKASDYMAKMKMALEPERPSTRKIHLELQEPGEQPIRWDAWHAHKRSGDVDRTIFVLVAPEDVRGVTHLIHQKTDGDYQQWVYLPFARRVRRVALEDSYQPFMGSDFTLAELGLVQLRDRSFTLLGKANVDGTPAIKIEEVPVEPWYYSKIVSWLTPDSMLPLRRDYYTPGGQLWKVQRFEAITVIDGVPTPLQITMDNKRADGTTHLYVKEIKYRDDIPEELFDPDKLRLVVEHPFWKTAAEE